MRTLSKGRVALLLVCSLLGSFGVSVVGLSSPASAAAPAIGVVIDSEAGDPVGNGAQGEYVPPDKVVTVTSSTSTVTFSVGGAPCSGASCDYVITLSMPTGGSWAADDYENAQKTPTAERPGIDVRSGTKDCATTSGRFGVFEAEVTGAALTRFVARFEQHCEGDDDALFGMVSFNPSSGAQWFSRSTSPDPVDFEDVQLGQAVQRTVKVTARPSSDPISMGAIKVVGSPDFTILSKSCDVVPVTVDCEMVVRYAPTTTGDAEARLNWVDELSPTGTGENLHEDTTGTGRDVLLKGFGANAAVTVDGSGAFGKSRAGLFTEPHDVTVTNVGNVPVTFTSPAVTGVNASSFAADDGCDEAVLEPTESCTVQVVAYPTAPTETVPQSGMLQLNHDAAVGPKALPLSVTGTGGYYVAEIDGTVHEFGDAEDLGDMNDYDVSLNAPMLGITSTSTGDGFWMVGSDGGIFSFGDAEFHGSTGGMRLNQPVLDMEAEVDDSGYWLAALDGGVFAFDAPFHGSMGGKHLNQPIVGMAAVPDGSGYWLVASDGGIFAFNAPFRGSTGSMKLNSPIVGMAATADGGGYWMVAEDGGVFAFGTAGFYGSLGGKQLSAPVVGIEPSPTGRGYWLLLADGVIANFGDAKDYGEVFDGDFDYFTLGMTGTAPPVRPTGAAGYFA